jgi:hypothetical protein
MGHPMYWKFHVWATRHRDLWNCLDLGPRPVELVFRPENPLTTAPNTNR